MRAEQNGIMQALENDPHGREAHVPVGDLAFETAANPNGADED